MSESVILEEDIDENYEPTQEEIEEYARFLQMDLPEDNDLLWIAKEGLKAPLPDPWKPCKTREDEIYYFNFETGDSTWEHPCDEYYRRQYQTHKAQKATKKQTETKKKRLPDPTLSVDLVDPTVKKSPGQFRSLDESKERDPVLKFEMEKKMRKEKQELEEKYRNEAAQLNREFEEKRAAYKRNFEQDLEQVRMQYRNLKENSTAEVQKWFESESEKTRANALKAVDSEEKAEKDRVLMEHQRQLQLLTEEYARKLTSEQEKIKIRQQEERESLIQSEENVKLAEIRRLTAELEEIKEKIQREKTKNKQNSAEIAASEAAAEREIAETIQKIREENDLKLNFERKIAEEKYQRELEIVKSQSGESAKRNMEMWQNKEEEIKADFAIRLKRAETEAELNFGSEQARLDLDFTSRLKQLSDIESTRAQASLTQELETYRLKVQRDLAQEKLNKENQANELRLEYQKRLGQNLEAERLRVQEELYSHSTDNPEIRLRQAISDTQKSLEMAEKELLRLTDSVKNTQKRPLNDPKIMDESSDNSEKLSHLEREMTSLKQILHRKEPAISPIPRIDDTSPLRVSLQREKQELKEQQKALELDRERWKLEVRQYENDPGSRSRLELQSVKKALDAKTRKLNEKIGEMKAIERWIQQHEGEKSLEFELEDEVSERKITDGKESLFDLSEDVAVSGVRPPMGFARATEGTLMPQLQSYDRQLSNYVQARTQAKAEVMRQEAWLAGNREELRYHTPGREFAP